MKSRRLFLSQFSRAILAAGAFGMSPFVPRANAIAPLVVVAIVQTAISVANLFSHGGDGIESLLRLQVEMLQQIQSELSIIEKQIQEILTRLEEIKEIIGELPKQVVIEQNRAAIEGLSSRFGEVRDTYIEEGRVLTPELETELQRDLISPIRYARDNLMAYPQPQFFLVPTICSACFVETFAMGLANTSSERRKQALLRYRRWFLNVSRGKSEASLEGRITALQQLQLADAKTARDAAANPTSTRCYTETHEEHFSSGLMSWWYKCYTDQISTTVTPMKDASISEALDEMVRKHLLQPDEKPVEVSISPTLLDVGVGRYTGTPRRSILQPDRCPGTGRTLVCSANDDSARANATTLSNNLTSNGLQLMSLHALRHAAERAIAFIDRIDPSVKNSRLDAHVF
jgi:hypothetical protein